MLSTIVFFFSVAEDAQAIKADDAAEEIIVESFYCCCCCYHQAG
jgi:hypothetical protein